MWSLKWILFGIFLVLHGLTLLGMGLGGTIGLVLGVCGVVSGILFLINR